MGDTGDSGTALQLSTCSRPRCTAACWVRCSRSRRTPGLHRLWIRYPGEEMFGGCRQRPGGYREAATNVREIRSHLAVGRRTPNRVAGCAGARREEITSPLHLRGARCSRGLTLLLQPCRELRLRFCNDSQGHVGVLQAAELRALPPEDAGPVGLNPDRRRYTLVSGPACRAGWAPRSCESRRVR
jgi:hypothetical protein